MHDARTLVASQGKIEGTIWAGPPGDLIAAASQLITNEKEFAKLFLQVSRAQKTENIKCSCTHMRLCNQQLRITTCSAETGGLEEKEGQRRHRRRHPVSGSEARHERWHCISETEGTRLRCEVMH